MDQRAFWLLLRRRWVAIVCFILLGAIAGSVYALRATPQYSAESELFVTAVGAANTADLAQGSNFSQQQARNFAVVATRQAVLQPVIETLGLDTTANALSRRVAVTVPLNTSLISISVTDTSPTRAAATANAVATSLANVVTQMVPKQSDGTSPVRMETVQRANPPSFPSAPNTKLVILLSLISGLVVGIAAVVLHEVAGAKIRTPEQIAEQLDLPILGTVAYDRRAVDRPIVSPLAGPSLRGEEFRQIRTNLHFVQAGQAHRAFVFTSSLPGEGKSSTAVNVAASLAATGSRVILVEADLRKPSIAQYLDLEGSVGLTTVLAGDISLDDAVQLWGPDRMPVLLSGQTPPNPSELLGSASAAQLFTELHRRFDVIVIDTPPILPVTDAAVLARLFGGVLLVIGCSKVEQRTLRKAVTTLTASGTPILGVIANMVPISLREHYQRAYVRRERKNGRHGRQPSERPDPVRRRHGTVPAGAETQPDASAEAAS